MGIEAFLEDNIVHAAIEIDFILITGFEKQYSLQWIEDIYDFAE